ncbi:hypothetical protein [Azospirillum brasilense]|uniref:hypothetical protein n=1 Tax=Azospirillum brasilense TaxID=192 RepID=UPI001EDA1FDD|nr:hypothetical protein [Azospirillum brasilense]UKJ72287.1 hypothetical protein H1Q64_09065 [Azospirillum brasilense]
MKRFFGIDVAIRRKFRNIAGSRRVSRTTPRMGTVRMLPSGRYRFDLMNTPDEHEGHTQCCARA